jgi:hypothetical protein
MPDLLAGTIIKALDTPPTVESVQTAFFNFDATTYGVDADSGTYVECGVAFTAPTTGRIMLMIKCGIDNNTAGAFTSMSSVIRDGATIGAGATFLAASDDRAILSFGTDGVYIGHTELVTGLTPGNSYNVRLEHRVGSGIGSLGSRWVAVAPAT